MIAQWHQNASAWILEMPIKKKIYTQSTVQGKQPAEGAEQHNFILLGSEV